MASTWYQSAPSWKCISGLLGDNMQHYVGKVLYTQMDLFTEEIPKPSCLDSAYERKAIDDNVNNTPVFPENILYLKHKRGEL